MNALKALGRCWFQRGSTVGLAALEQRGEMLHAITAKAVKEIDLEMRANGYDPEDEDYEVFIRVSRVGLPRKRKPEVWP